MVMLVSMDPPVFPVLLVHKGVLELKERQDPEDQELADCTHTYKKKKKKKHRDDKFFPTLACV